MADTHFCLMAISHWSTCMTKAEWSGWVQAIGSVGALLGIWYTVRKQRQLSVDAEDRQRADAAVASYSNAQAACAAVCAVLEQVHEGMATTNVAVLKLHRLRLGDGAALATTVRLECLPIEQRAAVIAVRAVAVTMTGCIDFVLDAPTDRARLAALEALRLAVLDSLPKMASYEQTLSHPPR